VSVLPRTVGVVGAGTMGAGIAQLGCAAGMRTLVHDPVPEALERGSAAVLDGLRRWSEKGRVGHEAAGLLEPVAELEGLAACDLVIEAAPERAQLKRELFGRLSETCGPETILATNTSSIPVTLLAGAASRPENVVGLHFFNPPPLMGLLEVIRADQTGERALAVARHTGDAMGKRVILAADGPAFLVNRCGRPWGAESLRLLQERLATHEQIDRICRLGGGFPMGPFELMDLVGIDVGLEVARSFTELSFGSRVGGRTRFRRGWWPPAGSGERPAAGTTTTAATAGTARTTRTRFGRAAEAAARWRCSAVDRWRTGCARGPGRPASGSPRAGMRGWCWTRAYPGRRATSRPSRSRSCAPDGASPPAA
jgi:3-hydroxyacyl-CoA dehydrogenase